MNLRATGKLLALPFTRYSWAAGLAAVLWAASLLAILPYSVAGSLCVVLMDFMTGAILGMALSSLARDEVLMLPAFRWPLAAAAGGYVLLLIGLPMFLVALVHPPLKATLAIGSALLLVATCGLCSGMSRRSHLFLPLPLALLFFLPEGMLEPVVHALFMSYWTPVLTVLISVLLASTVLRPLLTRHDSTDDESPMQAVALAQKPAAATDGMSKPRGLFARKIKPLYDAAAQRSLERALARHHRKPNHASRTAVLRAVLLPHDNPEVMGLNLVIISLASVLFMAFMPPSAGMAPRIVASYGMIAGLSRFTHIGQGMRAMGPNLADLYPALAPQTNAEFQATMARTLRKLIVVATINCLLYTTIIALVLRATAPGQVLLTALIVGSAAAPCGLAMQLIGPVSNVGRMLMHVVLIVGSLLVFNLVTSAMQHFGVVAGTVAGVILCLPFGLGTWQYARWAYLTRRPGFDVPIT